MARRLLKVAVIMELVMLGLVAFFLVPIGAYVYWVAAVKPRRGRELQQRVWQPLANRLGAAWTPSPGGARFHAMCVHTQAGKVTALVHDRGPIDAAIKHAVGGVDAGGWRTIIQADVVDGGPAFTIEPRHGKGGMPLGDPAVDQLHRIEPVMKTPPAAIAARFTPDARRALVGLGTRYSSITVGPSIIVLQLPGVCADAGALEAAIFAVAGLAGGPGPYLAAPPPTDPRAYAR